MSWRLHWYEAERLASDDAARPEIRRRLEPRGSVPGMASEQDIDEAVACWILDGECVRDTLTRVAAIAREAIRERDELRGELTATTAERDHLRDVALPEHRERIAELERQRDEAREALAAEESETRRALNQDNQRGDA